MTHESNPQALSDQAERLRVARIGKPHGVRGEVTVQLFTDDPEERLAPGSKLIREPGTSTASARLTELTVARQRWNKHICLLSFEEIADRNAAEELRGSVLYIEVLAAPEDDADEWYSHELEGLKCLGPDGHELGVISELITGPAQDLLLVTTASGDEVMVPFVEELVPEIDIEAKIIRLNPPQGLFPTE